MTIRCKHNWIEIGVNSWRPFPIYWCKICGAINKDGKTKSPKFYLERKDRLSEYY